MIKDKKKKKKQVFYSLYRKGDVDGDIINLMDFNNYKEIITYLKNNYNVDTTKQMISNSISFKSYIKDNFLVYKDYQ